MNAVRYGTMYKGRKKEGEKGSNRKRECGVWFSFNFLP
jgi:hypothetical protein